MVELYDWLAEGNATEVEETLLVEGEDVFKTRLLDQIRSTTRTRMRTGSMTRWCARSSRRRE